MKTNHIIGRTITNIKLNPFETGVESNPTSYDPVIYLDDGSAIFFMVDETEVGEYGISLHLAPGRLVPVKYILLVAEYKREYRRVNGKHMDIIYVGGGWYRLEDEHGGSLGFFRIRKIREMLEDLKERPDCA